jgi:hypothetical protein
MAYLLVFLVAAVAGGAVGLTTLFSDRVAVGNAEAWTEPYGEQGLPPAEASSPAEGRKRPLPLPPTARSRMLGVAGLALAVFVGASAIALLCLVMWVGLKRIFG